MLPSESSSPIEQLHGHCLAYHPLSSQSRKIIGDFLTCLHFTTLKIRFCIAKRYQQIFPVWTIAADCQDASRQRCFLSCSQRKLQNGNGAKVTKNQRQLATATSDNRINLWLESEILLQRFLHWRGRSFLMTLLISVLYSILSVYLFVHFVLARCLVTHQLLAPLIGHADTVRHFRSQSVQIVAIDKANSDNFDCITYFDLAR